MYELAITLAIDNLELAVGYNIKLALGLFGTAPELELSQIVSAPPKLGVKFGGALSQNVLELWSWV